MFHENRHFRDPSGQITRICRTPTAEGVALGIESDEIAYRHDAAGRVLSESGINGAVGYEWDALSNLTGLTLPGEQKLAWLHYGSGHVSAIRFGQQLVTEFTRDRLHREVRRTQGAREQFRQYDSLGRRTLQRSELSTDVTLPEQALLERLYRYTARGELSGVSDTLRGEVDYGYDAEGRLLKHYEARQGHSRAQFSYDAADNLAANDDAVPVTDNRLQHWQALFMKYDHWGNLVSRRNGLYEQHYAYDAENRLVSARGTGPEGRFEARYHYDALGRRTRKIVTTTHGTTDTRFLWQGYRLLQEQQESGLCSTYVYDPNEAWSPLARVDHLRDQSSGEIYWFNTDLNGAPLEVTDERGAVRWSGQYGSFGEVCHQSEGFSRVVNRTAMAHQPLRYAGQHADGETGLHYNLFRYYDPQVGRFIVQDPIGLNGGWNLYQYAPNPLGWIDPLGLASCTTKFKSRNAAFRAAKRDAGIPVSQQPSKVELVPLTDRNGKSILGDDHLPIKTREYTFSRPDGESIVIQDHSPGHIYGPPGTPGNQGPHLNVRPISDTRNGTISGTLEHYPF
ncbi:TPA: RHS domain-containing protein [Enterobacter cloacae]|nr:RHS domain-containing protein [Enterobacter cloacae]